MVDAVHHDYGHGGWTDPEHNAYQFKAGRCDTDRSWANANEIPINRINECHNRQALDLPNVATECPSDDDPEVNIQEDIYSSVYVDTFIKSESGWGYCTDPSTASCRNDTPDYSLLNY